MFLRCIKPVLDITITLFLWIYYILGYIVFFSPFYLGAFLFSTDRERAFQGLNCLFYRSFFRLVRTITPRLKIIIAPEVYAVRSSIVIANHLSFLDPILFISLFKKHKTIVKSTYFRIPIFGRILLLAGYLSPTLAANAGEPDIMDEIKKMRAYLASGGNLFIFPEGTRSRTGGIGSFEKGAFSIAKLCKATIKVVRITNTHKLFPPDSFLFNTCIPNVIEVKLVGSIEPDYENSAVPVSGLMNQARVLLEEKNM